MKIVLTGPMCQRAAAMLELAPPTLASSRLELCADSLREIAELEADYSHNIRIAYPWLDDAREAIAALCDMDHPHTEVVNAITFELFECLAIIAREHALNKGADRVSDTQKKVMQCFEAARDWGPNEDTLASYYYYHLIPGAKAPASA